MAHLLKYRHSFTSVVSGGVGRDWRIEILEKDYAGDVSDMVMSDDPIQFTRNPQAEGKMVNHYRVSCTLNIICESVFQYREFLQSEEDQYRVNVYVENVLYYPGIIVSDQNELALQLNAGFQITSTDGLSQLLTRSLRRSDNTAFSGIVSFGDYLKEFIASLGTDIVGVVDGLNLIPEPLDGSYSIIQRLTSGVLSYNHDVFKKNAGQANEQLFTWGEWLDTVLEPYGCCLEIVDGKLHITRVEVKADAYEAFELSTDLVQTGIITVNNRAHIWNQQDEEVHIMGESLYVTVEDIYSSQRCEFVNGANPGNAIINGDLADWGTPNNINSWTVSSPLTVTQVSGSSQQYGIRLNGKLSSFDTNVQPVAGSFIDSEEFQITVNDGAGLTMDLGFDYKVDSSDSLSGNFKLYYQIVFKNGDDIEHYYRSSNGTWSTGINYEELTAGSSYNQYHSHTINVIFNPPGVNAEEVYLFVRVFQVMEEQATNITAVTYSNFSGILTTADTVLFRQVDDVNALIRTIQPDAIDFAVGDASNFNTINGIKLGLHPSAGKTSLWARRGISESKYLLELLTETIMSDNFYGTGTWRLRGRLKGYFNFNSVIAFGSYELGEVIVLAFSGGTYDVSNEEWEGEWIQVGTGDLGAIVNSDGGFLRNSDNGKLIW